jgi:hypothetical protein
VLIYARQRSFKIFMKNIFVAFALVFAAAQGNAAPAPETWGGKHIGVTVVGNTAYFSFDCASGTAEGTWIVYRPGVVNARGTYLRGSGMALPPGQGHNATPVNYVARIQGNVMTLVIRTADGQTMGPAFTLKKGAASEIYHCM